MPTGRTAKVLALVTVFGTVLGVVVPASVATAGIPPVERATQTGPTAETRQTAQTGPTEIERCTAITEPGEYVLADDVENASPTRPRTGLGACIAIRADDVTLRGGNHTVSAGPGGEPGVVGILVENGSANVTVTDLTTTRWGAGVAVVGATGATFRNVSAVNNLGDGFFVENAPGVELRSGEIRGSNTGVFLRNSPDAVLGNLTVAENLAGISVRRSDGAMLSALDVRGHSQFGVAVFASANATIADSTLVGNGFADVALSRADSRLRNLTLSANNETEWALYAVRNSTAVGEAVRVGETGLSFEVRDVALDSPADAPPLPMTERQVVGDPLFVLPTGEGASLSLSVEFSDAEVEGASTTEESLSLWRFGAGEGWRRVETTVDVERNRASATVRNLNRNGTVVALVGEGLAESESENGTAPG